MKASSSFRILIADDQPDVLEALRLLLKGEGCQTESAPSPAGILAALEARDFDLLIMDLNYTRDTTSGREGIDLLARIQSIDGILPVVVMTAWGSVELAVEAMRHGARDFVQEPWDNARLLAIVSTQIELSRALRRGRLLEAENRLLAAEGRRRIAIHGAGDGPDRARRPIGRERAHHRRTRHRQGRCCAHDARDLWTLGPADGYSERGRPLRRRF